eukprot:3320554-Alexandrium_andersonii.AAC.1
MVHTDRNFPFAPPLASGVLWVKHDVDLPLCFDVDDLPQFGTLMDSGFLLWSAGGRSSDLLIPWGT